jgi:hypothetical protein
MCLVCVCPPPPYIFKQSVDSYEMQYGGYAIEGDIDATIFNPLTLTIPKWRTFILLRWMQNFHQSTWDPESL